MTTFDELITNAYTKRKSSTRAAYLIVITLSAVVVLTCMTVMIVDVFKEGRICVDYFEGISKILWVAVGLITAAGSIKTVSDRFQNSKDFEKNFSENIKT